MIAGAVFLVDAFTHPKLASLYSLMPELPEIFGNIQEDRALTKNVLSSQDTSTLAQTIQNIVLPVFLEYGVCRRDESRTCGYVTSHSNLSFAGVGRGANAKVAVKRAALIAEQFQSTDTSDDALSVSWMFEAMPDAARKEFFGELRKLVTNYSSVLENPLPKGKALRLVVIAR